MREGTIVPAAPLIDRLNGPKNSQTKIIGLSSPNEDSGGVAPNKPSPRDGFGLTLQTFEVSRLARKAFNPDKYDCTAGIAPLFAQKKNSGNIDRSLAKVEEKPFQLAVLILLRGANPHRRIENISGEVLNDFVDALRTPTKDAQLPRR
jgi:hypothetical protein